MILVDTSVWVDFLRSGSDGLSERLQEGLVLTHPWVLGELALGNLARRASLLDMLDNLPQAFLADATEVRELIGRAHLAGTGISYVDAQLLAGTMLTPGATLWTYDKRLAAVATRLGWAPPERPVAPCAEPGMCRRLPVLSSG